MRRPRRLKACATRRDASYYWWALLRTSPVRTKQTGVWALLVFRRVAVRVPGDAFEMNYVFTDGDPCSVPHC